MTMNEEQEQLQRLLGITSGISSVGGGIADIIAANKAIRKPIKI